jgi:hypothetical protein
MTEGLEVKVTLGGAGGEALLTERMRVCCVLPPGPMQVRS